MAPNSAARTAAIASIDPDLRRAEALLFDLAAELRYVPLEERTRRLHLRALDLKRELARWSSEPPDDARRTAIVDELVALGDEARRHRRVRRSGEVLLHARLKPRTAT